MRRRLALLAASSLTGLVLVSPGPAAATPLPDCFAVDFAQACYSPLEIDFVDEQLCPFPVDVHVDGSVRYRPFFTQDGLLTREERHLDFNGTIVNPATGRSFFDPGNFSDRATFYPDGSVERRETGRLHDAVVDDGQRLFHQSGLHSVLIDAGDQVLGETFRGRWESEPAFPGEVCPILATPR